MHFNFDFSAGQIIWTLTFAALLVLLVVLLGRDRVRRFPWFTTSMVLMALRMLAGRLLFHRIAPVVSDEIFLAMADVAAIVALLVVVEVARRAFVGAGRRAWIVGTVALACVGAWITAPIWYFPGNGVEVTIGRFHWISQWWTSHWHLLTFSGPWPSWKTLTSDSQLSTLRLMELIAQKLDLLSDVLIVQLGLLVMVFGRRFKAGWHSHVQQLAIGLFMASLSQLAIRGTLQHIATQITIHSQDDYKRVMGLIASLNNANSIIFIAVLVWWIVCLWVDEPGTKAAESEQLAANSE